MRKDQKLEFQLLFWGPKGAGKLTALKWLFENEGLSSGELHTTKDPVRGIIINNAILIHSNVPVNCFCISEYKEDGANRKEVFEGFDAIIFVWDSSSDAWENNIQSLKALLDLYEKKLIPGDDKLPEVSLGIMANKKDLPNIVPIHKILEFIKGAKLEAAYFYETIATKGINIKRIWTLIAHQAIIRYYQKVMKNKEEQGI